MCGNSRGHSYDTHTHTRWYARSNVSELVAEREKVLAGTFRRSALTAGRESAGGHLFLLLLRTPSPDRGPGVLLGSRDLAHFPSLNHQSETNQLHEVVRRYYFDLKGGDVDQKQ